jgi:hypothetical protein
MTSEKLGVYLGIALLTLIRWAIAFVAGYACASGIAQDLDATQWSELARAGFLVAALWTLSYRPDAK